MFLEFKKAHNIKKKPENTEREKQDGKAHPNFMVGESITRGTRVCGGVAAGPEAKAFLRNYSNSQIPNMFVNFFGLKFARLG